MWNKKIVGFCHMGAMTGKLGTCTRTIESMVAEECEDMVEEETEILGTLQFSS